MKIHCVCGKYMGEIRDASLRRGVVYLCSDCNTKRVAAEMAMKGRDKIKSADDFLRKVFGG